MGFALDRLTLTDIKAALQGTGPDRHPLPLLPEARRLMQLSGRPKLPDVVREEAERLLNTPPEPLIYSEFTLFHRTGDRSSYDSKYFNRRKRLAVFAVMYGLEETAEVWKTALEDTIWAICDEFTWCIPAHVGLFHPAYPAGIWEQAAPPRDSIDLFGGDTGFALTEILNLLGERLNPWVVARAEAELDKRILSLFFRDPSPQVWETKSNNWPAVCSACIGAVALYMESDNERLAGMLWRLLSCLKNYIHAFDDNGATPEGLHYWQFGFGYFLYFSELLRNRTAGRIDLFRDERVRRISSFPRACLLSGGKIVNFSDSEEDFVCHPGIFHRLHARLGGIRPPDGSGASEFWPGLIRSLAWSDRVSDSAGAAAETGDRTSDSADAAVETDDRTSDSADAAAEPGGRTSAGSDPTRPGRAEYYHFPQIQWWISKHGDASGLTAFAAKGGHNDEPHNHNDLGHFIVHADGVNILADLGSGVYTRQYFNEERYAHLHTGSQGHSVPVICGQHQSEGAEHRAKVLHSALSDRLLDIGLDLTAAYEVPGLAAFRRRFVWKALRSGRFRLQVEDEFRFASLPASLIEVFICALEPRLLKAGCAAVGPVRLHFDAAAYRYECVADTVESARGIRSKVWRMMLHCTERSERMAGAFLFTIPGPAERRKPA